MLSAQQFATQWNQKNPENEVSSSSLSQYIVAGTWPYAIEKAIGRQGNRQYIAYQMPDEWLADPRVCARLSKDYGGTFSAEGRGTVPVIKAYATQEFLDLLNEIKGDMPIWEFAIHIGVASSTYKNIIYRQQRVISRTYTNLALAYPLYADRLFDLLEGLIYRRFSQ